MSDVNCEAQKLEQQEATAKESCLDTRSESEPLQKEQESSINPNPDQIISLMNMYLNEWEHRDQMLWSQVFKYFYACLIVTVLPYAADKMQITLPEGMDSRYFPFVGVVMGFIFLYVGLGYAYRLKAIGDTYKRLNNMLPKVFQRDSIEDPSKYPIGRHFSARMSMILVIVMFFAIEFIAFFLLAGGM